MIKSFLPSVSYPGDYFFILLVPVISFISTLGGNQSEEAGYAIYRSEGMMNSGPGLSIVAHNCQLIFLFFKAIT